MLIRSCEKVKCNACNGTGFMPMGDGIRGLIHCTNCHGEGMIDSLKYEDLNKKDSTDKVIEWLEKNMNDLGLFYFVPGVTVDNYIHCYFKSDNTMFCTLYRDVIEKILEEEDE